MRSAPALLPKGNDPTPQPRRPFVIVDGPFAETKEYALWSRLDRTHPIRPRAA